MQIQNSIHSTSNRLTWKLRIFRLRKRVSARVFRFNPKPVSLSLQTLWRKSFSKTALEVGEKPLVDQKNPRLAERKKVDYYVEGGRDNEETER